MIVDPTYITLNDKELGTRTYHDQHFFCSECGDPFVTPGIKTRTFEGDGPFEGGEVGAEFTVFHGFPYCSKCHAKLRWPKCKKCKKSMAPDSDIIEALGAKWCSNCFVCTVSKDATSFRGCSNTNEFSGLPVTIQEWKAVLEGQETILSRLF